MHHGPELVELQSEFSWYSSEYPEHVRLLHLPLRGKTSCTVHITKGRQLLLKLCPSLLHRPLTLVAVAEVMFGPCNKLRSFSDFVCLDLLHLKLFDANQIYENNSIGSCLLYVKESTTELYNCFLCNIKSFNQKNIVFTI